jgi:hypothetical protein
MLTANMAMLSVAKARDPHRSSATPQIGEGLDQQENRCALGDVRLNPAEVFRHLRGEQAVAGGEKDNRARTDANAGSDDDLPAGKETRSAHLGTPFMKTVSVERGRRKQSIPPLP